MGWPPADGVLDLGVSDLGGGRRVRGASTRRGRTLAPSADLVVYLLGRRPVSLRPEDRWVRWRDFGTPGSTADTVAVLREVLVRAAAERVLIVCRGGRGRTGTALAGLLVLQGSTAAAAVDRVRRDYHPRAVETRRQRHWLDELAAQVGGR